MASPKPKASPSPQATKKSQVVVTTGQGSTIKMGDLGKKSPTPNPVKTRIGTVKEYTTAEYEALLRKIVAQNKNR
jgi:hypothetical protein